MKMEYVILFLFIVGFIVVACGGGSGGGDNKPPVIPVPSVLRSDLLYGYYGAQPGQAAEVADHANMFMTWGWGGPNWLDNVLNDFIQAKTLGINTLMLGLPQSYGEPVSAEASIRVAFNALRSANLLSSVKYLYPVDEPDIEAQGPKTDAQVNAVNAMLRRIAADYPELQGVQLAVIYGGDDKYYPGLSTYDVIGIDHYDAREGVLGDLTEDLKSRLRPDQFLMLVPGGGDPWKQDPTAFFNYAQAEPKVKIIMPFLWFDSHNKMQPDGSVLPGGHAGIKSNSRHCDYVIVGKKIKFPHVLTPTC